MSAVKLLGGVFVALGLLSAVIIEMTGPWRFTIASRPVSVSSSGPLLYALYVTTLLACFLRPRRCLDAGRQWVRRLEPRARTMVFAIALPIGLWMIVPSHTINFIGFLSNAGSRPVRREAETRATSRAGRTLRGPPGPPPRARNREG